MSLLALLGQIKITPVDIHLPTIGAGGSQLSNILNLVYVALAGFAILFIVLAAMRMVVQGSDAKAQQESRQAILYAAIALAISTVVIFAIQWIVKSVGG